MSDNRLTLFKCLDMAGLRFWLRVVMFGCICNAKYCISLGNICFKCLDISAYQTFVYQMDISVYVWKCLSLQGFHILKRTLTIELNQVNTCFTFQQLSIIERPLDPYS